MSTHQKRMLPGRRFVVEGRGTFPVDMLRYDSASFDTHADAEAAGDGYVSGLRRVALRSGAQRRPTYARWDSFGWRVVEEDSGSSTRTSPSVSPARAAKGRKAARARILNAEQVKAVYTAMCALNQVGGFMRTTIIETSADHLIGVRQMPSGSLEIIGNAACESYESQLAFATAYGLDPAALKGL